MYNVCATIFVAGTNMLPHRKPNVRVFYFSGLLSLPQGRVAHPSRLYNAAQAANDRTRWDTLTQAAGDGAAQLFYSPSPDIVNKNYPVNFMAECVILNVNV